MTTKKATKPETKPAAPKTTKKPDVTIEPAVDMNVKMDVRQIRTNLGLNQTQFWSRVFVTQSGGSRYENEREVPKPVQALLAIAYGSEAQAKAMVDHLRSKEV